MASWRDTTSTEAQADLDGMLEPAFGFAHEQLERHGEFFPFAVVVQPDGETSLVAAGLEERQPAPSDVVDACRAALAGRRDEFRATGVVAAVRVDDADAVRVELEHAEGAALTVLLPYTLDADRTVGWGSLQATAGPRYVWG